MRVRPSILPPLLDERLVQQLTDLANDIVDAIGDPEPLIAAFNAATGQQVDEWDIINACEGTRAAPVAPHRAI